VLRQKLPLYFCLLLAEPAGGIIVIVEGKVNSKYDVKENSLVLFDWYRYSVRQSGVLLQRMRFDFSVMVWSNDFTINICDHQEERSFDGKMYLFTRATVFVLRESSGIILKQIVSSL